MALENFDDLSWDLEDYDLLGGQGGFQSTGQSEKGKRKPATQVAGAFVDGFRTEMFSENTVDTIIKNALPTGYARTYDAAKEGVSGFKDVYGVAEDGFKDLLNETKKTLAKSKKGIEALLPEKYAKKIGDWADTYEKPYVPYQYDADGAQKQMGMGDVFAKYSQDQEDIKEANAYNRTAIDNATKLLSTALDGKYSERMIDELFSIRRLEEKHDAYREQLEIPYYKKTLELQFDQFFVMRKLLNVTEKMSAYDKEVGDKLVHNTALPEAVKIHNSELALQMMKQRTFGAVTERFSEKTRGVFTKIIQKTQKDVKSMFKDMGASLGNLKDYLEDATGTSEFDDPDMFDWDNASDEDRDEESRRRKSMGTKAGKFFADYIRDKMLPIIKDKVGNNESVKKYGLGLDNLMDDLPRYFNDFAGGKSSGNTFADLFRDVVGLKEFSYKENKQVKTNGVEDLDQIASFRMRTRRTIEEIIPGWLAKQTNLLEKIATGDDTIEEKTYNLESNRFETRSDVKKKIKEKFFDEDRQKTVSDNVVKVLDALDPDKKLSRDTREALLKSITTGAFDEEKRFNLETLAKDESLSEDSRNEIKRLITSLGGDFNSRDGDILSNMRADVTGTRDEIERRRAINQAMKVLRNATGKNKGMEEALKEARLGRDDMMEELGLVTRDKKGNINLNRDEQVNDIISRSKSKLWSGGWTGNGAWNEPKGEVHADEYVIRKDVVNQPGAKSFLDSFNQKGMSSLGQYDSGGFVNRSNKNTGGNNTIQSLVEAVRASNIKQELTKLSDLVAKQLGATISMATNGITVTSGDPKARRDQIRRALEAMGMDSHNVVKMATKIARGGAMVASKVGAKALELGDAAVATGIETIQKAPEAAEAFKDKSKEISDKLAPHLKTGLEAAKSGSLKAANIIGDVSTTVGGIAKDAAVAAAKDAKDATVRYLTDTTTDIFDVYYEGEENPIIPKDDFVNGRYYNIDTKQLIHSPAEMQEYVYDTRTNRTRQFELSRMVNDEGKPISAAAQSHFKRHMNTVHQKFIKNGRIAKALRAVKQKIDDWGDDIYVGDDKEPRLLGRKLRLGEYLLKETGDPVKGLEDLKGEVVDSEGNVVLSMEDYAKGLYYGDGRIVKKGLNLAGKIVGGFVKGYAWYLKKLGKLGMGIGKFALKGVRKLLGLKRKALKVPTPLQVDQEIKANKLEPTADTAVLTNLYTLMSERLPAAPLVKKFNDSEGDGIRDGSWLDQKLKRGLKTPEVKGVAAVAEKVPKKGLLATLLPLIGGFFAFIKSKVGIAFTFGAKVIKYLRAMAIAKGVAGAAGAAGDVAGTAAAGAAAGAGKGRIARIMSGVGRFAKTKGGKAAILAALAYGGYKMFGGGSDEEPAEGQDPDAPKPPAASQTPDVDPANDDGSSLGDKAATAGNIGLAAAPLAMSDRVRGWAGKGLKKIGSGLKSAAGFATNFIGKVPKGAAVRQGLMTAGRFVARQALWQGLRTAAVGAATAIAGAVSAPVLIGAAVVGAVAVGGYLLYKHLKKAHNVLFGFRMAQYGFNYKDNSYSEKLIEFEKKCLDFVMVTKESPATFTKGKGSDIPSMLGVFGIDPKDNETIERWLHWFQYRFKPIFLGAVTVYFRLTGSKNIHEADDKLSKAQKTTFLDQTNISQKENNPYLISASPFKDIEEVELGYSDVISRFDEAKKAIADLKDDKSDKDSQDTDKAKKDAKKEGGWLQNTKDAIKSFGSDMSKSISKGWNSVKAFGSKTWESAKETAGNIGGFVKDSGERIATATGEAVGQAYQGLKEGLTRLTGGQKELMKNVFNAFRGAGFSKNQALALTAEVGRENDYNPRYVFGGHTDAARDKNGNPIGNLGFISWNRDRRARLIKRAQEAGVLAGPNDIAHTKEGLDVMAKFVMEELKGPYNKAMASFLGNPNIDPEQAAPIIGKKYVGWAYGQSVLKGGKSFDWKSHDQRRRNYLNTLEKLVGTGDTEATTASNVPNEAPTGGSGGGGGGGSNSPASLANPTGKREPVDLTGNKPLAYPGQGTGILKEPGRDTVDTKFMKDNKIGFDLDKTTKDNTKIFNKVGADSVLRKDASDSNGQIKGGSNGILGSLNPEYIARGKQSYRLKDSGVNLSQMNKDFMTIFYAMIGEYNKLTSNVVQINSAWRSSQKQAALYEAYKKGGKLAAPPGKSKHEKGTAIDINSNNANGLEKAGLLKKYGFFRPLINHPTHPEPWHLEHGAFGAATSTATAVVDAAKAPVSPKIKDEIKKDKETVQGVQPIATAPSVPGDAFKDGVDPKTKQQMLNDPAGAKASKDITPAPQPVTTNGILDARASEQKMTAQANAQHEQMMMGNQNIMGSIANAAIESLKLHHSMDSKLSQIADTLARIEKSGGMTKGLASNTPDKKDSGQSTDQTTGADAQSSTTNANASKSSQPKANLPKDITKGKPLPVNLRS